MTKRPYCVVTAKMAIISGTKYGRNFFAQHHTHLYRFTLRLYGLRVIKYNTIYAFH